MVIRGGFIWSRFQSINQEGTSTVEYKSIDRAGNKEQPKEAILHIDTEPPEATIVFDPTRKDISVTGEDNLSAVAISDFGNRIILEDEAGNSTTLNFVEKNRRDLAKVSLLNILYDGVVLETLGNNRFHFNWSYTKQGGLNELQQDIFENSLLRLKASYNVKQDVTFIQGSDLVTVNKLNGLVLIKIKTNKGELNYIY